MSDHTFVSVPHYKIQSKSRPNIWYTVTEESCTCPDYMHRKRYHGGHCKHMRQVLEASENVVRAA